MLWLELVIVIGLILLNGFFAMSELAVVSAKKALLQQRAQAGSRGAMLALGLQAEPTRFLSTVQVGITAVGVVAGAYGGATLSVYVADWLRLTPELIDYADEIAFTAVVVAITYLSLVVGELVPKRIALNHAEGIAIRVAGFMAALSRYGAPVVWFLGASTRAVFKVLGLREVHDQVVTEEEVRSMIAEGTQAGVFETAEHQMILGVMKLADRPVRAIMTPRPDIVWIDPHDEWSAIGAEIIASGHSRFLVSTGEADQLEGVVQTKDLLAQALRGEAFDLMAAVKQPLVVHENTSILDLLEQFKSSTVHIAVVVDEYGSLQGLVTLTDIISVIAGGVGEDPDTAAQPIVRRADGSFLIDAMSDVAEVEQALSLKGLQSPDEYQTLAGFLLSRFGHIPETAERLNFQGWVFEVVDLDGRRIDKVLVIPPEDWEAGG